AIKEAQEVNPSLKTFTVSALKGIGVEELVGQLISALKKLRKDNA
ncbi:MAG: hypothetical protein GQ545_08915, partial [Candidatus Aminicenantes bacterium]|nr:hypothetical protein [Candidatus Aminicenantes bacterium]